MNFVLDHIWKIIFIAILVVGGWFWWQKNERKKDWDRTVQVFAGQIDPGKTGYQLDDREVHASYFRLLGKIKEFQKGVKEERIIPVKPTGDDAENIPEDPVVWLFHEVFAKYGMSESSLSGRLWRTALMENLQTAEQLGIFKDQKNLTALLEGRSPIISTGQYEKEKLVIVNKVPSIVAREARNHPANFSVVPESVAAMIGPDIDEKTKDTASSLANAKIIRTKTMEVIRRYYEDGRK